MSVKAPASRKKREISEQPVRKPPPSLPPLANDKSRAISERGRESLIDRYAPE
ncbi:hypothetical protein SAMN05444352_10864 [Pseudomonas japonica]|uniref:Uncharacterized protein n=1 Tax=Pseudomonas japonica TaxID=256466 RepID=A0A239ENQ5_9PSED|nr:hypothetical protein SAMN05444352_10864 [Pseudomonas japonica]